MALKKKTTLKIETVKWSWAKAVKNKEVYRDDEFVKTKTKAGALNAIELCMSQAKGLTYTITVFRDGHYYTYFRHSMPCLGGLVKYKDSHGEKYYMNPYFPRDIRVAYPEGDTIFIACHRPKIKESLSLPFFEFCLSQESPWVTAFNTKESIIFKDNYFVLTDMNTDPTVFYSLMRQGGLAYYYSSSTAKYNPKAELLLFKSTQADPRRLAGQKPIRTSGGTWAEGYGYTRPYNESIFKTKLPHKLKDFGKTSSTSGYPQAPHTNTYFVDTMKKKFGVDVAQVSMTLKLTPKIEEAAVEAWDYFKEEAKKLDDE